MFVLTADQIGSRHAADAVPEALRALSTPRAAWQLAPERTAGDEIQGVPADADAALRAVLTLHRLGGWRIGLGVGSIERPLPRSTREGRGPAYLAARRAVERAAARGSGHFALAAADADDEPNEDAQSTTAGAEALVKLLLDLRAARSDRGWEAYDLAEAGLSAEAAAERLGITASAYRQRRAAARIGLERDALTPISAALAALDEENGRS